MTKQPTQVSTNASFPIEDIVSSLSPSPNSPPPLFFQLYVSKTRSASEALLRQVWSLGIRTIFLTVDSPLAGKREADERVRMDDEQQGIPMMTGVDKPVNDKRGGGLGRITGSFIDEGLDWSDLPWLRRHWKGRIVLKGIMCAEDASRAAEEGLDGIVLRCVTLSPQPLFSLLPLQSSPHLLTKPLPWLFRHSLTQSRAIVIMAAATSTPPHPQSSSSSTSTSTPPTSSPPSKSTSTAASVAAPIS